MKFNKSQVSVFEIAVVFILFGSFVMYFYTGDVRSANEIDYKIKLDSAIDTIYFDNSSRVPIVEENIGFSSLTENWSNITSFLNYSLGEYELIIENEVNNSKLIVSCNETNGKMYVQRLVSISDNNNYNFRKLRLGVCY